MSIAVALAPVLLFLVLLQCMDSFKLVSLRSVIVAIAAGLVAALVCLSLHDALLARVHMDPRQFARYVAPVTEEVCKGAFIALLLWRHRVGFLRWRPDRTPESCTYDQFDVAEPVSFHDFVTDGVTHHL